MKAPTSDDRYRQAAIVFAALIGGVIITALFFLLIYEIRDVLPPFIYALILVYILRPPVNFIVSKNIPRLAAVSLVYLLLLIALILTVVFVLPTTITQMSDLITNFPEYLETGLTYFSDLRIAFYRINLPAGTEGLLQEATDNLRSVALRVFTSLPETTIGFFGGLLNIVLAPIIAFYLLKDLPIIKETIIGLMPAGYRDELEHILREIDSAVGGFLRGQLLISFVVAVTISIYLAIIGVNFPVLLGMLAGVLNIIPYFGPILGGAVAVIVALFESPRLALLVVVGMIAIQQFDSAIISPTIMKHTVNLHPTVVILALLVGGALFGLMGLLLAIPVAALLKALLLHYVYERPVAVDEAVEEGA